MPYLAGFVLYTWNSPQDKPTAVILHRLWLDENWVAKHLAPAQQSDEPYFFQDQSGKSFVVAPIRSREATVGIFVAQVEAIQAASLNEAVKSEMLTFSRTLAEELKFGILKAASFSKVEQLSRVDGLTGIFRRGVFDQRLAEEVLRAKTFKTKLGLMILDIDHFKNLNDQWGHPFGDTVLRRVAQTLRTSVYETDFVARYGGEEFAIILPRSDELGAAKKASLLRGAVEKEAFRHEGRADDIRCTISIGLAFFPQDAADGAGLIRAADEALYHSKESGRNRVTCRSQMT